jgi:xanthine dehydrogenase YagR molybdenum-binding subunit
VHRLIRGNTMTPTFTRGPGESVGSFVLETAMDELAYRLGLDPVELRLRNHTDVDGHGNAWSSDGLPECLRLGAQRFGWADRDPTPRARRDGDWLIGTGVASAGYPVPLLMPVQRARARLYADGGAVVEAGTQEFGTGVTTAMAQVGADALGVPLADVRFASGDTDLPNVSSAVGSAGAGMISAAVHAAATALRRQLVELAVGDAQSPLHGCDPADVEVVDARLRRRGRPDAGETYGELMQRNRLADAEALGSWTPPPLDTPHGLLTFGAQFAEVAVDPGARPGPDAPDARRVRAGPGAQPAAGPQPADGRDDLGNEPGPAGGQPDGPPARAVGGHEPRRIPGAGQRGRTGRDDRVRRGHRRRGQPARGQGRRRDRPGRRGRRSR